MGWVGLCFEGRLKLAVETLNETIGNGMVGGCTDAVCAKELSEMVDNGMASGQHVKRSIHVSR